MVPRELTLAVAAARSGAKTVLAERYGHLGGMATGGMVLMWPSLVAGLCQEIVDKADAMGGCLHMKKGEVGATDPKVVSYWQARTFGMGARGGTVGNAAYFDMEMLKCILNDMVDEAGVKLVLHSWGTRAIVEKDKVQGAVFETK